MNQSAMSSGAQPLSLPRVFAFSAANLPLGALVIAVAVYLPSYFASRLGVSLAVIGGAWATVRLLDVGVDPVLGMLMDRTRTRLGRYRAWLVASVPVLMIASYMLFMARPGVGGGYLVGWLLVLYLGMSIIQLAIYAWAATLTTDYHDRSRLFGVVALVGVIGAAAVLLIPILAKSFGLNGVESVQDMGWVVIGLTPLTVLVVVLSTPERVAREVAGQTFRIRDYTTLLVKPDLLRLYLAQMALTLGPGWMAALYVFFFTAARGYTGQQASLLLFVYILAGVVGAPATARLSRRLGKHRTLMVTTTAYSLGLCAVFLIPKASPLLAAPAMFWVGALAAGFNLMINAMLADVADEVRLEQGRERLSLLYALNTLAAKIAAAFAIGLSYPLLARLGYDATKGAANTPAAIHGLELAYIIGPIIFVMLGGVCVLGWRLDANRHGLIRQQLDARDAEQASEADPVSSALGAPTLGPVMPEPL